MASEVGPQEAASGASGSEALSLEKVLRWSGYKLDEMGGATVGRIDGVYVDARNGAPEWLLVRLGRFGQHCAVPARDAVEGAGHVWVPYGRDLIRRAPRIESGRPLERERELALLGHYGIVGEAGRAGELADRPDGEPTSRPAS